MNHFIEQPNRGKRSVGLDTSTPDGLELLMKLLETADVFVTNLLPDSRQRMGIDVEQVRARNPKIIYARGHATAPVATSPRRAASTWPPTGRAAASAMPIRPATAPTRRFSDRHSATPMVGWRSRAESPRPW